MEHHISLLQPFDPSVVAFPLPSFDHPQEFSAINRVEYDTTLRAQQSHCYGYLESGSIGFNAADPSAMSPDISGASSIIRTGVMPDSLVRRLVFVLPCPPYSNGPGALGCGGSNYKSAVLIAADLNTGIWKRTVSKSCLV